MPLSGRFLQVILRDDVVSVKDASCLVTGYCHGYTLRNTRPNHVPDTAAYLKERVDERSVCAWRAKKIDYLLRVIE